MTYAFADPSDLERLGIELEDNERHVELLNPMSVEQAVLRRTLLPGLLKSVSYNQRRGVPDVHLYEEGSVFLATEGKKQPKERTMVAGVLAGRWQRPTWNDSAATPNAPAQLDFFDGKGVIEELAESLGVQKLRFRAAEKPWLQPGRTAEVLIGSDVAGWLGEVHPRVLDAYDCEGAVDAFELSLPVLLRAASAAAAIRRRAALPGGGARHRAAGARGRDRRARRHRRSSRREGICSSRRGCSTCTAARAYPRAASRWHSR